ncbi:DUF2628 domain-containing protein [Anaerolentibacter hominis]|uniref:DUF2628 domain-containing protein n=1 Tax=Anaerolentibacter hominis TaxID=3079009 RepID=UPI0031B87700
MTDYNGFDFGPDAAGTKDRIDGYLVSDIHLITGQDKAEHYTEKFRDLENGRHPFHIPAMLAAPLWMAYRKMWRGFGIYWCVCAAVSFLWSFLVQSAQKYSVISYDLFQRISGISTLLSIAISVIFGFVAYRLYWNHTRRILSRAGCKDRAPVPDPALEKGLAEKGGTSIGFIVLAVAYNFFLNQLINYLIAVFSGTISW